LGFYQRKNKEVDEMIFDNDTDSRSFFNQQERPSKMNVLAVLTDEKTGKKKWIHGANIVTVFGNRFYALAPTGNSASIATPLGIMLGIGSTAVSNTDSVIMTSFASCFGSLTAGYPKNSDADVDNTGSGSNIVTWAVTFVAAGISQVGIRELCLCSVSNVTPNTILNRALFSAAFDKTTSDTLKVFINHTMLGV
jgi:hypothetical protein